MSLIGPLISPWPVEQSVLALYRTWLPTYLAEVERQEGLAHKTLVRPAHDSYIGGEDFNSWVDPPCVIVVVKPVGAPERSASVYVQCFEIQVGLVVLGVEVEEEGRKLASLYGAAAQFMAKPHVPSGLELSGIPQMVGSPDVRWIDPEKRREALSIVTFHLYVTTLELGGPDGDTPAEVPEYQGVEEPFKPEPIVESGEVTVQAEVL